MSLSVDIGSPPGFFSKKLAPAETRYNTFGQELLGIYLTTKHCRHCLKGQVFHILTDHKPITYALQAAHSRRLSPWESWHLSFITEFTNAIRHVKNTDNSAANALSRIPCCNAIPNAVDFAALTAAQKGDQGI